MVYAIRERCDPQSVGLPNAVIRSRAIINERISGSDHPRQIRRVIANDDPRSVRYEDGVTHSQ